jgi:hypothetical protein
MKEQEEEIFYSHKDVQVKLKISPRRIPVRRYTRLHEYLRPEARTQALQQSPSKQKWFAPKYYSWRAIPYAYAIL